MTDEERLEALKQIVDDPETRAPFFRLIKKKFPKANIPEIDAADALRHAIDSELATSKKELEELKDELRTERATRIIQQEREKWRGAPWYFSEEDMKAVEDIMVAKQIGTFKTAAEYYRDRVEPLKPNGYGISSRTRAPKGKHYREMLRDPNSELMKAAINGGRSNRKAREWANREAAEAFEEIRSGQVEV
jgi:hypothetical protein